MLPKGWNLLKTENDTISITESNTLWKIIQIFNQYQQKSGYFGAAYCNEDLKHIVVVSRGTDANLIKKVIKDWYGANFPGIYQGKITRQQNKDYQFAKEIIQNNFHKKYTFSLSGHSLGAWLAQYALFELMHDISIQHININFPLFAIVFDSPGGGAMLKKLQQTRVSPNSKDDIFYSITAYQATPNPVNMIGQHIGLYYQLPTPLDLDQNTSYGNALNYMINSISTHTLKVLLAQFDEDEYPYSQK